MFIDVLNIKKDQRTVKSVSVLSEEEINDLGYVIGCDLRLVLKDLSDI